MVYNYEDLGLSNKQVGCVRPFVGHFLTILSISNVLSLFIYNIMGFWVFLEKLDLTWLYVRTFLGFLIWLWIDNCTQCQVKVYQMQIAVNPTTYQLLIKSQPVTGNIKAIKVGFLEKTSWNENEFRLEWFFKNDPFFTVQVAT